MNFNQLGISRTERAGEEGCTCLFIDPRDSWRLEEIEKAIKFKIPRRDLGEEKHGYK
jgi:ATP-dependent RNA helicase DeaD